MLRTAGASPFMCPAHLKPGAIFLHYPGLARTVYDTLYMTVYCDFPVKNAVYTPYIYGSGQPYIFLIWYAS
jgi:hypothetical protein